jgi:hypothetical protein
MKTLFASPSRAAGPLVSPRVAAELSGVALPVIYNLIREGKARSERIKGILFIDLDDVEAYARAIAEGVSR